MEEWSFSIKSSDHCAMPGSLFNSSGLPLPLLLFKPWNSYFLLPIQTWLSKNGHVNRFLKHASLLKSKQVLSKHFSSGQGSSLWELPAATGRQCLDGGQDKPIVMAHDKIVSPLLYKQKLFNKINVSKRSTYSCFTEHEMGLKDGIKWIIKLKKWCLVILYTKVPTWVLHCLSETVSRLGFFLWSLSLFNCRLSFIFHFHAGTATR